MKKYKNVVIFLLIGICMFTATTVGTQAYLVNGSDSLWNRFVSGNVAVALTQPQEKPGVINKGSLDAWIFLEVSVPQKTIRCVDSETHKKTEPEKSALISFQKNDGWKLLNQKEDQDQIIYTYGYERLLTPEESTASLFEKASVVNCLEGELDSETKWTMTVKAFAVQGNIVRREDGVEEAYQSFLGGDAL